MSCSSCSETEECSIDFVALVQSLRTDLANLKMEGGGTIASDDSKFKELLYAYPICVQLAVVELNISIGMKKITQ